MAARITLLGLSGLDGGLDGGGLDGGRLNGDGLGLKD